MTRLKQLKLECFECIKQLFSNIYTLQSTQITEQFSIHYQATIGRDINSNVCTFADNFYPMN